MKFLCVLGTFSVHLTILSSEGKVTLLKTYKIVIRIDASQM